MKKQFFLLIALVSFASQAQEKKWTLIECVDYALEHNISIQQSELDLEVAEINKKDAFGNFLPSLNASASHSWNIGLNQNITTGILENLTTQFTSFGVSSSFDIYAGLQNQRQMHRSKLAILAGEYQLDKMKDDISLFVANAFLQILFNKEQLKVLQAQNVITQENLQRTQEMVNAGTLPEGDLLEIKATDATQKQEIIAAENTLFISKLSLAQLLQIKDYQNFDIVDESYDIFAEDILSESASDIVDKAKEVVNDVKIAETNTEVAEYDLKISRGAYQPSLSGYYGYDTRASYSDIIVGSELDPNNPSRIIGVVEGTGQNVLTPNYVSVIGGPRDLFDQFSINDGHNLGLRLNIPIFNGFAVRNNVQRQMVNLERAKYQQEQAELDLEANVYQAYNDAKNAKKAYEAALQTEEARQLAFEYSKERYNVGLSNAFDFNQSRTQYENSQSEVIRTKYDYIFKLKVLEFYFGIPITQIN
ncbi:TolC family protein [Mangrovimonas xylaniphaga]|uniref:TolC family protein n=1 Tax=Mangrovimonas xylaniphaga TaxID=1645915 RepID=UPI0006B3FB3F|nr:TolC family protein [Mangrovimonas xylaniphaga]